MVKVDLFKQSKNFCGPASLRIVLSHYGLDKSEDELAVLMNASRVDGTEPENVVEAARTLGFLKSFMKKEATLEELRKMVITDMPAIVLWSSPEEGDHYSVVVDLADDLITMADPLLGDYRNLEIDDFMQRWTELEYYPSRVVIVLQK